MLAISKVLSSGCSLSKSMGSDSPSELLPWPFGILREGKFSVYGSCHVQSSQVYMNDSLQQDADMLPKSAARRRRRDHVSRRFLQSPLSWALEPENRIPLFMWPLGPLQI